MNYWDKIEHPRFYGRVRDSELAAHLPEDLAQLANYLVTDHAMTMEGLYLENYRAPERVLVMNGPLPLMALKEAFPAKNGLRYTEWGVISDKSFSQLVGPQG
jgi:hypothetical protein